jgi:hypothetical protein
MTADPDRIATAWALLAELGVSLSDLQDDRRPRVPTLAEYLSQVIDAAGPGARRTYRPYWQRMATAWDGRPLDTIAASDIEALQREVAASARSRANSRSGRHAGEHVIAAARAVYNRAIADGLIDATAGPAHRVVKPRRLPNGRRALTVDELTETWPPAPAATTPSSTRSCCGSTPKQRTAAALRSACGSRTSSPTAGSSGCVRRAEPCDGSQSRSTSRPA